MTVPDPAAGVTMRAALVSDALDRLGARRQCLGHDVVALTPGRALVGRAHTMAVERVAAPPDVPYVGLLAALDGLASGQVVVIATDRADDVAVWGELVSTAAMARGVAGVVTDGLVRDLETVRGLGFPVYGRGTVPYDINGRFEVVGTGGPAAIDGVGIAEGDLIVADADGVVVVPAAAEADVLAIVAEKDAGESEFRRAVREGMAASEAFRRYGVL